jgi:cyclopropane-fatty-acyl-phospholipid synthase
MQFIVLPGIPERECPDLTNVYALPDAEFLSLSTVSQSFESSGFELRDLENLREHYVLTLRHWAKGLEQHAEQSRRLLDEVTYRIWKMHIASWAYGFHAGKLNLYQALLVKDAKKGGLPLTREDWHARREVIKGTIEKESNESREWSP